MANFPLPSTGNTISFNDIRIELGVGSATPFDIAGAAAGNFGNGVQNCQGPWPDSGSAAGTNPDSISEWWSYNGSQTASFFLTGDDSGNSCADACYGSAPYSCFDTIYKFNPSSKYYSDVNCKFPYSGYIVAPTNCTSGTKIGQTCYEISSGVEISQYTCTSCAPFGGACVDSSDCCDGGCCNGFCALQAC